MYGEIKIPSAREYCYLGITVTLTGSFGTAQQKLKQNGMRAYFSLKQSIDFKAMKKTVLLKHFDALVFPVSTYGCQVCLLSHFFSKNSVKEIRRPEK